MPADLSKHRRVDIGKYISSSSTGLNGRRGRDIRFKSIPERERERQVKLVVGRKWAPLICWQVAETTCSAAATQSLLIAADERTNERAGWKKYSTSALVWFGPF